MVDHVIDEPCQQVINRGDTAAGRLAQAGQALPGRHGLAHHLVLDAGVASCPAVELPGVAQLHRPEPRLQVLAALLQREAAQLELHRPGRRLQHADSLGTAELDYPRVGRHLLAQQVDDEGAPRIPLARRDDRVVRGVDRQYEESTGSLRRQGLSGSPDPGHEGPGVVRSRWSAPWNQGIAQTRARELVGQLDVALPVLMARGTGTPVAAEGEAVVHQVHRAAGQEPGQLRRQHRLADPSRRVHHHRLRRGGEELRDLSGLRDQDNGLRHLQERRRRQELVRRSPQGGEHRPGSYQPVRFKRGSTPGDVFLQPQRAVIRRPGQEGTDVLTEQVGQLQQRRGARIDSELPAKLPRQVLRQPQAAPDVAGYPRAGRAGLLADVTQCPDDSVIDGPVGDELERDPLPQPGTGVAQRREPARESLQGVLKAGTPSRAGRPALSSA